MLALYNLTVTRGDVTVIDTLSLRLLPGTTHILMGPNGSGKSTLAYTLMGHPRCTLVTGSLVYNGKEISGMPTYERARLGIFLATQHQHELSGVSVISFLKEITTACTQKNISHEDLLAQIEKLLPLVGLTKDFLERSVHAQFSGGEKKRFELLQMLLIKPKIAILDEIDSGIDVDGLKSLTSICQHLRAEVPEICFLFITHNTSLARSFSSDQIHIIKQGKIVASGTTELLSLIEQQGYDALTSF